MTGRGIHFDSQLDSNLSAAPPVATDIAIDSVTNNIYIAYNDGRIGACDTDRSVCSTVYKDPEEKEIGFITTDPHGYGIN